MKPTKIKLEIVVDENYTKTGELRPSLKAKLDKKKSRN